MKSGRLNTGQVLGLASAIAGFVCAAYFEISGKVPGVVLFIPIGTLLTRVQDPTAFSRWVWGHLGLGLAGVVLFGIASLARKSKGGIQGEITNGASRRKGREE